VHVSKFDSHSIVTQNTLLYFRCKKCRYEKCLSVGMDPKWVMTNEQKKIRFQHYFKKKQEREATGSTTTTSRTERCVHMVHGAVMKIYHRV
jgi:hypothetical protein